MSSVQAFPRILSLLRKERGITQKYASQQLGVSQALLSHYEKGIRECGLAFVVKAADFYQVSCDYLLGRTPDRTGAVITVDEIPEDDPDLKDNQYRGSVLPVLNKKLIINSLNIIFDLLTQCNNQALTAEASAYLSSAVYMVFRLIYSGNPKNSSSLFSIPPYMYKASITGELARTAATLEYLSNGNNVGKHKAPNIKKMPMMSSESLTERYPMFATSLFNLLNNAETRIEENNN